MTEQHPSFGGVAVADPRTTASPLDLGSDTESTDNRRKLALVGAVVAVLVVLVAAFFLLKGSGSSNNTALPPHIVPPVTSGSTTGTAAGTTTASAPKPIKLPKPFAGVVGRDPFKPLYVEPAPKTPTTPSGPASNPVPVAPVPPVTTAGGPSTTPTTGTGSSTPSLGANFDPIWVGLVHVTGTKSATFIVGYSNGKRTTTVTYTVAAPQNTTRAVFGRVFSLLSIQNGTATVQLGDGTPFDLSKGFSNRHFLG